VIAPGKLDEFVKLTQDIAAALGGTVSKPPTLDNYWYAEIDTPQMPVALDLRGADGRVGASPVWPRYKDERGTRQGIYARDVLDYEQRKNPPTTDISSAISRGAVAIAKDITRRLFPSALPVYQAAVKRCADNEAHVDGKAATTRRLGKALGVEVHDNGARAALYVDGGLVLSISSADSVRFEHFYCDPETALKVAELVRAAKKDDAAG
jgi:hypothetical protein